MRADRVQIEVVYWKLILQVTFFSSRRPTTDGLKLILRMR